MWPRAEGYRQEPVAADAEKAPFTARGDTDVSTYLMGLDAGGRSVRCSLVEVESGRVVGAARPWQPIPAPEVGFFAFSLDTERCWHLAGEAAREAMHKAGAAPSQVMGIATTGMRFSLVVMDREGRVLLASPNRDARAAGEGIQLAEDHGTLFNQRTGHWPSPIFMAARLRWLAANAPDVLARAAWACSLSDWLAFRLTGETATDRSQAGETLLFDLETRDWAWDLIDTLGLPRRLFPAVRAPALSLDRSPRRLPRRWASCRARRWPWAARTPSAACWARAPPGTARWRSSREAPRPCSW